MCRTIILLVSLFITGQSFAQQYPFVHYSPKDGLVSNQVRGIYQDSKGKLYFTSINGLSVYDGARFINYNSVNGLDNNIVNCVLEMGNDSMWITTNDSRIYSLVNNKLRKIVLKQPPPLIDNLIRDNKGILYAASEHGLFVFEKDRFIKIPFINTEGKDINSFISNICPIGRYLLITRDNSLVDAEERYIVYLYDKETHRITAQTKTGSVFSVTSAPDGRTWASTGTNIIALDTAELQKGKIVFRKLPRVFENMPTGPFNFINFDQYCNFWMTDKLTALNKIDPEGSLISYTITSGLNNMDISQVFEDKEGTAWIATYSGGVDKLAQHNLSSSTGAFGISSIASIWYSAAKDHVLFYSYSNSKAVIAGNNSVRIFSVVPSGKFLQLFETAKGIFGISEQGLYKIRINGNRMYPGIFLPGDPVYRINNPIEDRNGNLIGCGKDYLIAVSGDRMIQKRINDYVDHAALDTSGNIWIASRMGKVTMYRPYTDDSANYLAEEKIIAKTLNGISPRSITIDKDNRIWIGTRKDGIHIFKLENGGLRLQFRVHTSTGLSDNFISHIVCDGDNNIWACSSSGLDKISIKNGSPVIENITRQNNIYQGMLNIVISKDNTVWGQHAGGLIKVTSNKRDRTGYMPSLLLSMIRSGKDTIPASIKGSLSYKQNNISFYFGATSFLDEKQVLYSYRLEGGNNTQWSEPSNSAFVSFISLNPGDYTLYIKANFPAGRYPEQMIRYSFSIAPPWWQAWWFKAAVILLGIGVLATGIRFYYRRKLEKQKVILEKQQAIEKERTRIAIDMHDDLGAGLSRIKFLSQSLANKKMEDEHTRISLEKITGYSDEMAEKMGEIIWALNEKNDTLADLVAYTRSYTMEYLANHGIQCEANTPLHLPGTFIQGEVRRNTFLSVKECLHNIVKHANASRVEFSVQLNRGIEIIIHDNGKGINLNNQRINSNGLENIRKRMKEMNGQAQFIDEQGTKVTLYIPMSV